ncbi:MAG: dihydroorotate dehydrogenase-like protein [Gammaproteobacteria bacterium]|nr:dihydroorotate dehydrogenase-like protein [Gammaproteobacteria bacterium]
MVDITSEYLGLKLKNPLVPSASPLSANLDSARRLEDAGAAALVMHSLFEEKIEYENSHLERFFHQQSLGHGEAESFHPVPDDYRTYQDDYLEHLRKLKSTLDIPVIASLNGITNGGWIEYGKLLQEAGADALELNVYYLAANHEETAQEVEQRYVEILHALKGHVTIPITMKLSPHFSALVNMVRQLELAGARGVALFNRFYQPDIDLDTLRVEPKLELSTSAESLLRIRWTAILYGQTRCNIAVTGGLRTYKDVLKALFAGADVTHLCSTLLQSGPEYLGRILQQMSEWLDSNEYASISQLKGSVSQQHAIDPAAFERANYINVLDSYTHPRGVLR